MERIYSDRYMLVRPDGSVLNKQQVLKDLRQKGLKFRSIELKDPVARIFDSVGILTAKNKSISSRDGREAQAHLRFVAVYAEEGEALRLVHFQSTTLN